MSAPCTHVVIAGSAIDLGSMRLTSRNTLDTTAAGEASDGGLRDALNVVTKNLAMALGAAFAEALSTLAAYAVRQSPCQVAMKPVGEAWKGSRPVIVCVCVDNLVAGWSVAGGGVWRKGGAVRCAGLEKWWN